MAPRKKTSPVEADLVEPVDPESIPPEDLEAGLDKRVGYVAVDTDAELAVVAAIFTSPDAYFDAFQKLTPDDFGDQRLAAVYQAIIACDVAGKPFDEITVADELKRTKLLTKVGGVEALRAIRDRGAQVSNVAAHIEIVSEKAVLRRLVTAGRTLTSSAMTPEADAKTVLSEAERAVMEIGKERGRTSLVEMPQAVAAAMEELTKTRSSALVGISTGFRDLDKICSGFQPGQLIVVAARPGAGKSAFGLQLARNMAAGSGLRVPFLSYEMGTTELTTRLLSADLEHPMNRLRSGDLPAGMEEDLVHYAEELSRTPLLIDDNPPKTIGGVSSQMRRLAQREPLGAIVVDYLQLMDSDRSGRDPNRAQEVGDISRGLKQLGTELRVPVIALSQLNRSLENRPNKRPMLSDLRESGSIEQDASLVLFLYREHLYNAAANPNMAECIVGKQRNGPQGTVYLEWIGECTKFKTTDERPLPVGAPAPAAGGGSSSGGGFGGNGNAF